MRISIGPNRENPTPYFYFFYFITFYTGNQITSIKYKTNQLNIILYYSPPPPPPPPRYTTGGPLKQVILSRLNILSWLKLCSPNEDTNSTQSGKSDTYSTIPIKHLSWLKPSSPNEDVNGPKSGNPRASTTSSVALTREYRADVPPDDEIQQSVPQHRRTRPTEAKVVGDVESLGEGIPLNANGLRLFQSKFIATQGEGAGREQSL